jgi:hypothetical protein
MKGIYSFKLLVQLQLNRFNIINNYVLCQYKTYCFRFFNAIAGDGDNETLFGSKNRAESVRKHPVFEGVLHE